MEPINLNNAHLRTSVNVSLTSERSGRVWAVILPDRSSALATPTGFVLESGFNATDSSALAYTEDNLGLTTGSEAYVSYEDALYWNIKTLATNPNSGIKAPGRICQ